MTHGSAAMTQHAFDRRTELGKRSSILDDLEKRIVAEALTADRFTADAAAARRFALGTDVSLRIGKRHVANIVGRTARRRRVAKLFD